MGPAGGSASRQGVGAKGRADGTAQAGAYAGRARTPWAHGTAVRGGGGHSGGRTRLACGSAVGVRTAEAKGG